MEKIIVWGRLRSFHTYSGHDTVRNKILCFQLRDDGQIFVLYIVTGGRTFQMVDGIEVQSRESVMPHHVLVGVK